MKDEQADPRGPQRIAPLDVDALDDDILNLMQRLRIVASAVKGRGVAIFDGLLTREAGVSDADYAAKLADLPDPMRLMFHHPELFSRLTDLGVALLQGALPLRDRELVVLRMGWLCQAAYLWGEHVIFAKANAGLTSEDIERVVQGSAAPGWSAHERALLRAAEELHASAMISDETWATLSQRFDEKQLIELLVLIGQYQATAYYQNALRLPLFEGNVGLAAR